MWLSGTTDRRSGSGEQRGHDGRSSTFGDAAAVQSPFLDEHDALSPAAGDSASRRNSGRRTHAAAKNRGIVNSRETWASSAAVD
jgi:hypothetical protein